MPLKLLEGVPIPWLAQQVAGIRHPSQVAGLAVPPILALAALGLDRLLRARWPQLQLSMADTPGASPTLPLDLRWLLAIPLALAVLDAKAFGSQWIAVTRLDPEVHQVLAALRTADLQWVNPPFGEHYWIEPAVGAGMKLHFGIQAWHWKDRPPPEPVLEASRAGPPPGMHPYLVVAGVPIYRAPPGREYAAVTHPDGERTVCTARGLGGDIDVTCEISKAGRLVVQENSWSGWHASIDGAPAPLLPGRWLSVDLPPGRHQVALRYRPWDVPLGMALFVVGVGVVACCLLRPGTATVEVV
ncbi:MAG TPA: hypothetical protein VIN09_06755 [Chloroflexota bacterium]